MGIVQAQGSIDLAQFWPAGTSDADTTKIQIDLAAGGFTYRPHPGARARRTNVYDRAYVLDRGRRKAIVGNGRFTVRLQGIDAPELHVTPRYTRELGSLAGTGEWKEYRQAQGETATVLLARRLRRGGRDRVACQFVTRVDDELGPSDAVDVYGRFVGEVLVGGLNLNLWTLEAGLTLVSLYNSMTRSEIAAAVAAWRRGRAKPSGIARRFTREVLRLDAASVFRGTGAPIVDEGAARFTHPKVFRRQVTWHAYRKAGRFDGSFGDFLDRFARRDELHRLDEFLRDGPLSVQASPLPEFVPGGRRLAAAPEEIVFREAAGSIYVDARIPSRW